LGQKPLSQIPFTVLQKHKMAKEKGVYQGRQKGTTKAQPQRARQLLQRGLNAAEIATALGVSQRTVFRYLADH
jgi:DNA invertase Pin-like site-specific DNA recombinase